MWRTLNLIPMKKTLIIALAGMMLFAFTQCGGGNKSESSSTSSTKGSKQYTETVDMCKEMEKLIKDASTCDDLQEVALAVALDPLAIGMSNEYAADEKMTEKEENKIKDVFEDLGKKVEAKAKKLGCDDD